MATRALLNRFQRAAWEGTYLKRLSWKQGIQRRYFLATSGYAPVRIAEDVTMTDHVLSRSHLWPNKTAIIDGRTNTSYTFEQLKGAVKKYGSAYTRLGSRKGDVTCIMAPNSTDYLIALLGTINIGGVITGVNPTYTAAEVASQLDDSEAKYLVTIPELLPKVDEVTKIYKGLQEVYTIGEVPGFTCVGDMIADDGSAFPNICINPVEDVAFLPYSSGTTGKPKGVMLTHYNIVAVVEQNGHEGCAAFREDDVIISVLPLFHIGGSAFATLSSLYMGTTNVFYPTFDFEEYLQAISKYKANVLGIPPTVFVRMAKDSLTDNYDLSSVQRVVFGAAPCGAEIIEQFSEKYPGVTAMQQVYGMTETAGLTHITYPGDMEHLMKGSVGQLVPNMQCKICDIETADVLGPWQTGEVYVKGPSLMKGYLKRPDATKETFSHDGWLKTGDAGQLDEDGRLYIGDRLKEFIKYKSYQVAPAELEDVLLSHGAVSEAAVVGVLDSHAGELPRAYVVLKKDRFIAEEDVLKYVEGKVAPYKKLRGGVKFVDEIPKNQSGKLLRRVLKEMANAEKK